MSARPSAQPPAAKRPQQASSAQQPQPIQNQMLLARTPAFPSAPDAQNKHTTPGRPTFVASPVIPASPSSFFPSALINPNAAAAAQHQQPLVFPRSIKVLADIARGAAGGLHNSSKNSGSNNNNRTMTPTAPATPQRNRNAVLGAFWSEVCHLVTQYGGGLVASASATGAAAAHHGSVSSSSRSVTPARAANTTTTPSGGLAGLGSPRGLAAANRTLSSGSVNNLSNESLADAASNDSGGGGSAATPTSASAASLFRHMDTGAAAMRAKFYDAFRQLCESAAIIVYDLSSVSLQRAAKQQQQQQQNQQQQSSKAGSGSSNSESPCASVGSAAAMHNGEITILDLLSDLAEYVGQCVGIPKDALLRHAPAYGATPTAASGVSVDRASSAATLNNNTGGRDKRAAGGAVSNSSNIGGASPRDTMSSAVSMAGTASTIAGAVTNNNNNHAGRSGRSDAGGSVSTTAMLANPRGHRRQREEAAASASMVLTRGLQQLHHHHGGSGHGGSGLDNALFEALGGPIHQQGIDIPPEKQNVFMPWTLPEPYPTSVILERVPIGRFNASKFGMQTNLAAPGNNSSSSSTARPSSGGDAAAVPPQRNSSSASSNSSGTSALGYATVLDICNQAATPDVYSKWVARNRALRVPTADGGDATLLFLRAAGLTSDCAASPTTSAASTASSAAGNGNNNAGNANKIKSPPLPAAMTFPHCGDASVMGGGTSIAAAMDDLVAASSSGGGGGGQQSSSSAAAAAAAASSMQVPREWLASFVHYGCWCTTESRDAHGSKTPAWKPVLPSKQGTSPRMDGQAGPPAPAMTPLTL